MGKNLIYNGDFSHGTDSWSGSGITASNGVVTLTGDLVQNNLNYLIPVSSNRRYKLTFDLKVNTKTSSSFYIALRPYDNNKQSIGIHLTNKAISNAETTLAAQLKNGDTTVTLTSGTNWPTSRTYQRIGICNKLAWGYKRATYSQSYQSISENIITLKAAWVGGTWASGTKVAEFEDGSTYYYPWYTSSANLPTEWTTYTAEFNGGNSIRYSCQYFMFSTLGYSHNYSMRNIKIECISDEQQSNWEIYNDYQINKQGKIQANIFDETCPKIRYIKDWISGNTVNTSNHWNQFRVFNKVGQNIAWGKDLKYGSGTSQTGTYVNSVATDGLINSSYISGSGGNNSWTMLDLGYLQEISKIHIWHYYPDSRTYYNNKTQVSVDGSNWYTVYAGQKLETIQGNQILLSNPLPMLMNNGVIKANQFYQI